MSDIDVVREIYTALAARDISRLLELIDETFVVTQDPRLPWGGRHVGHEGFGTFAVALSGAIDSAVTTEGLFAADDEVIQFGRTRGTVRANGAGFDVPEVHRWKVRDGKAVEAHFAIDTSGMLAALEA
jgi:ketosteroid isomerase-like protein